MRRLGLLVVLAALVLSPAAARAASKENKDRLAKDRAAKKACLTGETAKGVAILTDLYILTNDPTYIYNQGRCFEQNQRYEDAIGRFREYLVKAKASNGDERADAEQHIATCQSYLGKKEPEATPAPIPAPVTQSIPTPSVVPVVPPVAVLPAAAEKPSGGGRGLVIAGIVAGGVGVLGIVGGALSHMHANTLLDEAGTGTYDPSKEDSSKSFRKLEWISFGVGAAALVTGTILVVLGSSSKGSSSISIAPILGPDAGGLWLHGSY
jgi:hypothetical protein